MSKISLAPDASGTGIFTIASPNSNTNRTLTLPDDTGTIVTNSGNQAGSFTTLAASSTATFAAGAVGTPAITTTGDTNTGIFFPAADTIAFAEGGAEAMRIDSSGNLLLGTTSYESGAFGAGFGMNINTSRPQMLLRNSATTETAYMGIAGNIFYVATEDAIPLAFVTSDTERARITSAGFFKAKGNETNYINTTGSHHEFISGTGDNIIWARSTAASPYGYYVDFTNDPNNAANYVFGADSGGNLVYRIFSNGTTSARSDAKWKKNIETARDGYIDDLARLRVVKYNWHNHEDGTPKEMGLIAQEVEEVFPGLVQEDEEKRDEVRTREIPAVLDEDGNEVEPARTEEYTEQVGTGEYTKSIKFSVFTPMLIKAVQELKAITDTQAQTISALEARIAALETGV
jgi:hypothetical protein